MLLPTDSREILSATNLPQQDLRAIPHDPRIDSLPEEHQTLVLRALAPESYPEFGGSLRSLVRLGGMDSIRALAILLSETTSDDGALADLSMGGRHVTVYSLTKAMLKIADVSRLSLYEDIEPSVSLTKKEKREVWDFVKSLAIGEHGDVEVATGVRSLLFERMGQITGVGTALEIILRIGGMIDGKPSGSPPRLLFVLYDLPWVFRSKIPFASVDSRKDNLAELLYRRS